MRTTVDRTAGGGTAGPNESPGDAILIDAKAAARMLGVSTRTVARLCDRDAMPRPVRIGTSLRWRRDELAEWIAAGCPGGGR